MKHLAAYCLLLATVLAGMIPAGWMPVTATDGKVLLVICTSDGVQETWVDLGTSEGEGHIPADENMTDRSCPYAAPASLAHWQTDVFALPHAPGLSERWESQGFTHHSAGFHWRYDARGPPVFS